MSVTITEAAYIIGQAVDEKIQERITAIPVGDAVADSSISVIMDRLNNIDHNVSRVVREKAIINPVAPTGLMIAQPTTPTIAPIRAVYGMDAATGKSITGFAHIDQSIADILKTLISHRCMNRRYGCDLRKYQDFPSTEFYRLKRYASIAEAIKKHEPRIDVVRITPFRDPDDQSTQQVKLLFNIEWTLKKAYQWIAQKELKPTDLTTIYNSKIRAEAA